MNEIKLNLAIQMFNFVPGGDWDRIRSMEEVRDLLRQLKEDGYDGVEWCNFMLNRDFMDVRLLKKAMDELGLKTCGMHFHYNTAETLPQDCKTAVERCLILDCPYLVMGFSVPGTFGIEPEKPAAEGPHGTSGPVFSPEQIDAWAREADEVLRVMKEACRGTGICVLYHNHADELKTGACGRDLLDSIHPDGQEYDIYWIAKGLDGKVSTALQYVRDRKEAIRLIHIKDGLNGSVFPNEMCGWGKGTYPIQKIVDCAKELGLDWIISENDAPMNFGTSGLEDAKETADWAKQSIRF